MNTILKLLVKDLKRDRKRPWSLLLFSSLPLIMTALMASIFGGGSKGASMPTIHVAIMDQDKDMLSGMLRSLPAQGEAAKSLQLHFVEDRQQGVRLLENRKASAFVVVPTNMTENLLKGNTNTIELYENPAEQVLPKIVRQGVTLLAVVLSGAAEILREPLTSIRELFHGSDFPADAAVISATTESLQKLRNVRTYLFPPLIQFQTVAAKDYILSSTNQPLTRPQP